MTQPYSHNSGESRPLRQIVLLLFTAAVSFALGMFIGRTSAPVQPIVKVTMPVEVQPATEQNFNFYKALPKGETPALGSGINHGSARPAAPAETPAATDNRMETDTPLATTERAETTPTAAPKPGKDPAQGAWILQAASSTSEENAQNLGKRLRSKGYKTVVKPFQVKGKTWYRVYVGPYATDVATKEAAAKLSRQEGLTPIARKL
ncbi:MAG: SPOR domain-containing protein [Desulfuromonadales bacterium]|nr:SPOR domain-containing protein [Desulfuromonadales bacterium]